MTIHVCPKCYEEGRLVQVKFIGNHGIVMWCEECQEAYYEEDAQTDAV